MGYALFISNAVITGVLVGEGTQNSLLGGAAFMALMTIGCGLDMLGRGK